MAEPDPIDRMVAAYSDAPAGSSTIWRMRAAVKELRRIARDDPRGRTREIAWLDGIIAEHESQTYE